MLLRVTTQVRVDRSVPELFDAVPILDLTTLEYVHDLVSRLLALGLLTDEKV